MVNMVSLKLGAAVAALAGLVSAIPTSAKREVLLFHLKTQVQDGGDARFNDLYLESYHTGAGLSDAVLTTNKADAVPGHINDTHVVFDLGQNGEATNGLFISEHIQSTGWSFVTIDAGEGDAGFSRGDDGTLAFNGTYFSGFLACDWWHNAPQLFWWIGYYDYALPSSCANVTLVTENV